ncbi:MAG: glutamine synthetase adenylyltransferase [Planctomycetaceae bacterium]|nr:glutamine synthetase adenylyltransferase [Planctomycetaceae bacterium]
MFPQFDKLVASELDHNAELLAAADFPDPTGSVRSLNRLRDAWLDTRPPQPVDSRDYGPPWFKTLKRIFLEAPFPNVVVEAVDTFVHRCDSPGEAFELFRETPRSLEVLARLSCGSPFLTQTLMDQPDALRQLTTERRTAAMKSREDFLEDAQLAVADCSTNEEKLRTLRQIQRREILRIGMCDAFGLLDLKFVTLQISLLADALVQTCLEIACDDYGVATSPFAVIALGKHGGEELNYSSDIDLIFIGTFDATSAKIARGLIDGLSCKMTTGFLYRVDMRLRPWGDAGALVSTPETYHDYLRTSAEPWEKQALLKARRVAGPEEPAAAFFADLPEVLFDTTESEVVAGVRSMKEKIEARLRRAGQLETEIKLGSGSIRDIEFLVQALQLIHGRSQPQLASPNTLDALVRLAEFGVLNATVYRQLREGYIFLRTIEHALQLLHNQQTHELPAGENQREWLARRMDYPDAATLLERFNEHRRAVRHAFDERFHAPGGQSAASPEKTAPARPARAQSLLPASLQQLENSTALTAEQILQDVATGSVCRVQIVTVSELPDHCVVMIAASRGSGIMSMISGLFLANDLDIREGDAMHGPGTNQLLMNVPAGMFLGLFVCKEMATGNADSVAARTASLEADLQELINLQHSGQNREVRSALVKMFCEQVARLPLPGTPLDDFSAVISQPSPERPTEMKITADDTFGFLFEVTNALSICGFRIRRAEIGESRGRIDDVLHITESSGEPVLRPERIEELQTAVTLIKQFTNWLPNTNEPHSALLRFRDLLQLLLPEAHWESSAARLKQPRVLQAVAQVLGVSRYLWEDFLRVKTANLLPLLTAPEALQTRISRTDLELEVDGLLAASIEQADQRQALNEFKDHHLFRIDLRHVLGFCGPFGSFAAEVTELAEVVVESACRLTFERLERKHGRPTLPDGGECRFTIASLGKFGGIEMGFASDIEMFLVFEADGQTNGPICVASSVFFERLIQGMTECIQSRHKGIFEIDLRMRPYGQAGSPAVSLATFDRYYRAAGDAWPYERQSLVKLRCVCGQPDFASVLQQHTHNVIYRRAGFDFDAMRAMREQQVRQLVHGGTINAKLSDGGLVDCEYAVQAIQMTFGHEHHSLRTSNTLMALQAACRVGLLTESETQQVRTAYTFLRQLIDCLRMARGNALDLTIPAADSPEYQLLARRLQTVHESSLRLHDLEEQLAAVRTFASRVEQICHDRS